ncbi:GP46-like surface antigen, putative, partial [Bodo saltans]
NLQYLSLYFNSLSGTLPASWGNMSSLRQLLLYSNSLSGSDGRSTPLYSLDVMDRNMRLSESPCDGPSWGDMSSLWNLYLYSNSLSGTLPVSWGNMSSLWYLYLYSNSLSGTLPASWGKYRSDVMDMNRRLSESPCDGRSTPLYSPLRSLYLYSNSLSGTLPASWGNMSSLQYLHLYSNSLSGTLPASWGDMSGLRSLHLYSNSLSGTLPSSWNVLFQINVSNNCLTGSIPTTFSAATSRIQWIDVCNTGVWPRNFSISRVAVCIPNTIRRCTIRSDSSALSAVTTSWSRSYRTVTTLPLESQSQSYLPWLGGCGAAGVQLTPLISLLAATPAFIFVDIVSPDAGNEGFEPAAPHVIVVNAIDRAEILQNPVVRMNISLMTQAFNTKRWDLANITMTGIGPLRFTIVNRSDDVVPMRWFVALVNPPKRIGGWITDSVPLFVDATFSMNLIFSCDVESTLSITVMIPSTGVPRALAGGVETSAKSTQIISLLSTGGAGSSLGRLLATRSLILCDADSAMNGGVLDMGIVICATTSTTGVVAARSAIVNNLLLVVVLFSVLAVAMLSFRYQMPALMPLDTFCFPSSLLPALTIVGPSTAAAATYLLARLGSSACVAGDVVLGVVGLAVAGCPCCFVVYVWTSLERHKSAVSCERSDVRHTADFDGCIGTVVAAVRKGAERRWKWKYDDVSQFKYAWVLLLDVRLLWYAVMDSALLVVIAIAAVIGGLSGSGDVDSCRGWSIVVIVLMCIQLLVLLYYQPFTSLFEKKTAFQLAFLYESSSTSVSQLWLVDASAVCGLIVVGVSGLKTLMDLRDVAAACRRRFTILQTLWRNGLSAVNRSNETQSEEEHRKPELMPIDAVLDHQPMLLLDDVRDEILLPDSSIASSEFDEQFWDSDGNALAQDIGRTQMHFL